MELSLSPFFTPDPSQDFSIFTGADKTGKDIFLGGLSSVKLRRWKATLFCVAHLGVGGSVGGFPPGEAPI